MSLTAPADAGDYLALDAPGGALLAEWSGGEFHYTKIDSAEPAPMILDDSDLARVIRPSGFAGVGLDDVTLATGPGIDIDSTVGVRLFGAGGAVTIFLDRSDGSAYFAGDVEIGGDTFIDGDTTIDGTLTVDADATFWGLLVVKASGVDVLSVGPGGLSMVGRFESGDGSIFIEDDVIGLGTTTITFSGSQAQFSDDLTVAGSIQVSTNATINGTATFNGNVVLGNGIGDTVTGTGTFTYTGSGSVSGSWTVSGALIADGNVVLGNSTTDTVGFHGSAGVGRGALGTRTLGSGQTAAAMIDLVNHLQARGMLTHNFS